MGSDLRTPDPIGQLVETITDLTRRVAALELRTAAIGATSDLPPTPPDGTPLIHEGMLKVSVGGRWAPVCTVSGQPWLSWAPSIIGHVSNPSLGNGAGTWGRYAVFAGGLCWAQATIQLGASFNPGEGVYDFTLPVAQSGPFAAMYGPAALQDASAGLWRVGIVSSAESTSGVHLIYDGGVVSSDRPWVWAAGDIICYSAFYHCNL